MLDTLPGIVMKAVKGAGSDPDAKAAIIEVQARCLGISVALMTRGDTKATNDLLEGASQYALEQAASTHLVNDLMDKALKTLGR
jgi:hypothetical protein